MIRARKARALAIVSMLALGLGVSQLAWGTETAASDVSAEGTSTTEVTTTVESTPPPPVLTPAEKYATDPEYRSSVQAARRKALKHRSAARGWCTKRARYSTRLGRCGTEAFTKRLTNSKDLAVEQRKAQQWRRAHSQQYLSYRSEVRYWNRLDRSMWKAVDAAAKEYGVSASWLHACVSSEGGHGGWVMNHQGSGAGGWFQFMESTFYGYVDSARSGNRFPKKYARWDSRVGQAFTAAYMFKIGESNQWTGAGC